MCAGAYLGRPRVPELLVSSLWFLCFRWLWVGLWTGFRFCALVLVVLKTVFNLFLAHLPRGVPEEGPDCHFPWQIVGLGPMSARIRGAVYF